MKEFLMFISFIFNIILLYYLVKISNKSIKYMVETRHLIMVYLLVILGLSDRVSNLTKLDNVVIEFPDNFVERVKVLEEKLNNVNIDYFRNYISIKKK